MICSVLDLAHFLGKRWPIILLEEIALGKFVGFNDTLKRADITPKTLSNQLKEMENIGIVKKNGSEETLYTLTEKGIEFRKIVQEIKKFNIKWGDIKEDCSDKSCLECEKVSKPVDAV
ncbi:MAG TPA: helix-turn-helix domain-containing protein [archaeon]|nr:helix-turn-helix domain-containing protein [archaeon]